MPADGGHTPVLLEEAVQALDYSVDGAFVDCTFGRGGHSRAMLARMGDNARLLALDKDPQAIATGQELASRDRRFEIIRSSFSELAEVAGEELCGIPVRGVLFDLGVSSPQLDDPSRGFSFQHDGPLDMRMNPDTGLSAAEWLAASSESELARVLRDFGEERHARRIARVIVRERKLSPIDTTARLASIISSAVPSRERGKHPATRSFQAIRIRVNEELEQLRKGLESATGLLAPGGRLVVISFHSLEDRCVKWFIRDEANPDTGPFPVPVTQSPARLKSVGKPVRPTAHECDDNVRARSAVMRVAEKLG